MYPRSSVQLLQSVQRYKFESNSQRNFTDVLVWSSCCNQYKDTNLKAIHNYLDNSEILAVVVAISTKIQIWKQFTTTQRFMYLSVLLLQSVQRYKFESNSQLGGIGSLFGMGCCNQYKDTNLKAIHNCDAWGRTIGSVVAISTKIQIWKQFTTPEFSHIGEQPLLQSVQRYKFESNSQQPEWNNPS